MNMMILMLKLLLTYINELNFCDVFPNNSATNVKLLTTKIYKKHAFSWKSCQTFSTIIKNWFTIGLLKLLVKKVFLLLGLTTAAYSVDSSIQEKHFETRITMLIISNKEIQDTMKIVTYLEDHDFMVKCVTERTEDETKE